jgi:hypothetical protein
MQIIIQGGMWKNTIETAEYYLQLNFVEKVILSTWNDTEVPIINNNKIIVLKNVKPEISSGNLNYQIVSSLNGLKFVDSQDNIVAKMRSDQRIFHDSMKEMHEFFVKNSKIVELNYFDKIGPVAPIFVLGMGSHFPFHPQDHVFWGNKNDLWNLFNIPLMSGEIVTKTNNTNFNIDLRQPIYLGANYCALFKPQILDYIKNFREYLTDNAPKRNESMKLSEEIRDKIFKVFPRIKMYWIKYNSDYMYSLYEPQGEYYAN